MPGSRVLVVDDEPDVARIAKRMLESGGFQADEFTEPVRAFKHFEENASGYLLVLSDVRMPEVSGIELASAIHEVRADIPILLMTAFESDTYELPEFIRKQDILRKPLTSEKLYDAVMKRFDVTISE